MKRLLLTVALITLSATAANAIHLVSIAGERVNMRSGPGKTRRYSGNLGKDTLSRFWRPRASGTRFQILKATSAGSTENWSIAPPPDRQEAGRQYPQRPRHQLPDHRQSQLRGGIQNPQTEQKRLGTDQTRKWSGRLGQTNPALGLVTAPDHNNTLTSQAISTQPNTTEAPA